MPLIDQIWVNSVFIFVNFYLFKFFFEVKHLLSVSFILVDVRSWSSYNYSCAWVIDTLSSYADIVTRK